MRTDFLCKSCEYRPRFCGCPSNCSCGTRQVIDWCLKKYQVDYDIQTDGRIYNNNVTCTIELHDDLLILYNFSLYYNCYECCY